MGFVLSGCQTNTRTAVEEIPIEYHYVRERLDGSEKNTLISLARKYGITNVEKIDVHYALPTNDKVILLHEKETINGRTVRTRSLRIECIRWNAATDDSPETLKRRINDSVPSQTGGFRVLTEYVDTQRILRIDGSEHRIHVDEIIPTEVAEDVVGKILKVEVAGSEAYVSQVKGALARGGKLTSLRAAGADRFVIEVWQYASALKATFSRDPGSGELKIIGFGYIAI
jgi:hypothetical protein